MADLKQYIFFDFEMLCANRGMSFSNMEAIRLGAVKYELETGKIQHFDKYIQPVNKKPISKFCRELTGICDADLKDAPNFKTVFEEFLTWVGGVKKSRFFSWSTSDLTRLKLDAELHHLPESTVKKIEKRYIDFQGIFTKRVTRNNPSVENALAFYGMSFVGEKHNPMYDALNTLRIYLSFLNKPKQTDLLMVKKFILENIPNNEKELNQSIIDSLYKDLHNYTEHLQEMYRIRDASKIVKKTRQLVEKYENVLINRSGIFSKDIVSQVSLLVEFYHELLLCYDEHISHSSKVMIIDESVFYPMDQFNLKRG